MPEQHPPAREHKTLSDLEARSATANGDLLPAVSGPGFRVVMRGYDRFAVDAYVAQTRRQLDELQATRSPEAAVRRALEQVGDEVAGILQRAHETASQISSDSRREAEETLAAARHDADETLAAARERLVDLDTDTDRIWAERDRIVGDARELARQLLDLAEAAAQRFPPADEPTVAHVVDLDEEAPLDDDYPPLED